MTEDIIVNEDITVWQALQKLNINSKKVIFVEKDKKLVAVVTDGDVRRWILANGSLEAPIKNAANYQPKYLKEKDVSKAFSFMRTHEIDAIPILNEQHEIVEIIFRKEEMQHPMTNELQNVPVIIMAGGLGTRLYPYTKILPKPLIPVKDIPIIEHIMNEFHNYGCRDFYLIVNYKKNMINAYFKESDVKYNVTYADEEEPLGTGGGLALLKGKINSTFILSNCDILIKDDIAKIYKLHKEQGNMITMVCSAKNFTIPYGIVQIDEHGEIEKMKEKPSLSFLTNTGCYIVEPEVIDELEEFVPVDFPDIIKKCKGNGKKVGVYPISENAWLDMGQVEELKKMELTLMDEN